jgi:hypothetical protein
MNDGELITGESTAAAGDGKIQLQQTGDSNPRIQIDGDGKHTWGSGSGAGDVTLERTGAGVVKCSNVMWANTYLKAETGAQLKQQGSIPGTGLGNYNTITAVGDRNYIIDDNNVAHDIGVLHRQTWNIGRGSKQHAPGGSSIESDLDVSMDFDDQSALGTSLWQFKQTANDHNFSTHIAYNYAQFDMGYSQSRGEIVSGGSIALYDNVRRAVVTATSLTATSVKVVVRCRINYAVTNPMGTCRVGICEAGGASTESTTFTPTSSWAEYVHTGTVGSMAAYANNLCWFVEFSHDLTLDDTDEIEAILDVEYVEVTQWAR